MLSQRKPIAPSSFLDITPANAQDVKINQIILNIIKPLLDQHLNTLLSSGTPPPNKTSTNLKWCRGEPPDIYITYITLHSESDWQRHSSPTAMTQKLNWQSPEHLDTHQDHYEVHNSASAKLTSLCTYTQPACNCATEHLAAWRIARQPPTTNGPPFQGTSL